MRLLCFQSTASLWLSFLGRTIGKNPYFFVVIPILVSLAMSHWLFNLRINREPEDLFTATHGRATQERRRTENLFTNGSSTIARQTRIDNGEIIQAVPRDRGTVFRKGFFEDLIALDKIIREFNVKWNNIPVNFSVICAKVFGRCVENHVLELYSLISENGLGRNRVKYPLDLNNATFNLKEYILSLGGVETDEDGYIIQAKAIRLLYLLDRGNHTRSKQIKHWFRGLNHFLRTIKFDNLLFSSFNYENAIDELTLISEQALPHIPTLICSVAIFACLSCMTNDLIRSKPLVGISSCISAILAIISGFGLCFTIGIPFTDFHAFIAFVILAIEVDDAFIIVAAWRKTSPKDSVPKRMQQTYSTTAVSITITSVTNIISYIIGIFAPFPIATYACIYCAATAFFSYIYLITFFGGCLALDGYREEKMKNPFLFFRKGRTDSSCVRRSEEKKEFLMRKFSDLIGGALSYSFVKIAIVIIFLVDLAVGIWGIRYLISGNDFKDFFNDNSDLFRFEGWHYKYFSQYSYPIHVIFDQPLDYADPNTQKCLDDLMKKIEAHPHIADNVLRVSWLKYYKMFSNSVAAPILLRGYNMSRKEDFVEGLSNVFLKIGRAQEFADDIIFNEDYTDIVASRFLIPIKDINSTDVEREVQNHVYSIIDQSTLPVHVFSLTFHWLEHSHLIKTTMLTSAIVASILIFFLFFLFVPNFVCSLCIFAVVICMFCETVGYMSLWGVKLDLVSLNTLIVCVGFSINYPTHCSFSFINAKNMKPEDRVKHALYDVGVPVVQGSLSTLIGIMILAFQVHYGIRSIFKVVFLITIQTAFCSLFFLMALLSIFGRWDKSLSIGKQSLNSGTHEYILTSKIETYDSDESEPLK